MTFISNLFSILWRVPAAIGIIKAIMDIVGSDAVKQILEAIRGAVQSDPNPTPTTEFERRGLFQRIRDRVALRLLGVSGSQHSDAVLACPDRPPAVKSVPECPSSETSGIYAHDT